MHLARIFVTGASGLVGVAVCERLLRDGAAVVAMGHRRPPPRGVAVVEATLDDRAALVRALCGVDAIVHCAAVFEGQEIERVNVMATRNLVDAANEAEVTRFVHLSSAMVYSPGAFVRASESRSLGPIDPYGQSKLESEVVVRDGFRGAATSLRPASIYGEFGGRIVDLTRASLALPVLPSSTVPIDLVHAADVALAISAALRASSLATAYNLAGPSSAPFSDLARAAATALGRSPAFLPAERLVGRVPPQLLEAATFERTLSFEAARNDLGFAPTIDWRDAFPRACAAASA